MTFRHWFVLAGLALLLAVVVVGYVATDSGNAGSLAGETPSATAGVDRRPLETARRLAPLATTAEEQELAREALQVGDHSVDVAFTIALLEAAEHPADSSPQIKAIRARIQAAEGFVAEDSARLARLTNALQKGSAADTERVDTELELAKAQLELHQGDLAEARDDLLRAGGDPAGRIRQMVADHDSTDHSAGAKPAVDSTRKTSTQRGLVGDLAQWRVVHDKQKSLRQAQQEATSGIATLTAQRQTLAQRVDQAGAAAGEDLLTKTRRLSADQKMLAGLTRRVEDQVSLLDVYSRWSAVAASQQRAVLHSIFLGIAWVLVILVAVVALGAWLERLFVRIAPERRRLHTLRTVTRFAVNGLGVLGIILVLVGPPSQLATVIGLAGAGLTVALKDFIVGFFGWFALMGRNGIRLGDWVEINGVSGEVIEITPFHTVLLETGNWTEAGHPTGRKVTFSNGFAIEGHYFNFSTTGQWLWDEVEFVLPPAEAPSIMDAIRATITKETEDNAKLAEQEWSRVTTARAVSAFSAAPSIDVRPAPDGLHVFVRYITRAHERHRLRTRLYQVVVELLGRTTATEAPASPSVQ